MSFKRRALYQLFTKGKYSALQQWSKTSKQSAYLHLHFFLEQINWVYKVNHEYLASFIRVSTFRIDIKIDKKIYEIHNFIYLPILSIVVNALSSITANNIFTYLFRCWNSFSTRIQQHEMTQRNSFFLYLVFYLNLASQYYYLAIKRMLKYHLILFYR